MEKENIDYQTLNDSSKCESFSKINVLSFTENGKKFICNPNLQKQYVFSIKNDKIIIDKLSNTNDNNSMTLNSLLIKDIIGFSFNAFLIDLKNSEILKGKEIINKSLEYNLTDEIENLKKQNDEELKRKIIINFSLSLLSKVNTSCCSCCCCCCKSSSKERSLTDFELLILVDKIAIFEEFNLFVSLLSKFLNLNIKNDNDQKYSHILIKNNNISLPIVKKRYLLYLNPIGGQGTALKCWKKVENLFVNKNSFVEIEKFYTDYYRHAYDNTLNIKDNNMYQGIICCSGDGIIHEVINAIMERDRINNEFWDIPVGVIPAGTSNALAKTLVNNAESYDLNEENAAYLILRGDSLWIDLAEIEFLNEQKRVYFFLSLCLAFIADVDLDSEL